MTTEYSDPLVTFYNERFARETPWTLADVLESQWKVVYTLKRAESLLAERSVECRELAKKIHKLENPKVECPRPHKLLLKGETCPSCKQTMR